jgi:hypothetical protein
MWFLRTSGPPRSAGDDGDYDAESHHRPPKPKGSRSGGRPNLAVADTLTILAQPCNRRVALRPAFVVPTHFGSNAFVAGRALTSRASSCPRKVLFYRDTGRVQKSRLSQALQGLGSSLSPNTRAAFGFGRASHLILTTDMLRELMPLFAVVRAKRPRLVIAPLSALQGLGNFPIVTDSNCQRSYFFLELLPHRSELSPVHRRLLIAREARQLPPKKHRGQS